MSTSALGCVFVAAGYLLGSIPFGLIVARRLAGVDVRRTGSGNIGATNVTRAAGRKLGLVTLVLDVAKGGLPVAAAALFLGRPGEPGPWAAATGIAGMLGHVFPPWLRFRGGKGVATALGIFLALSPLSALAALVGFAAAFAASHIVSVGSLVGAACGALAAAALHGRESPVTWAALAMLVVVVARHRTNLARLARGEERRLGQ